MEIAQLLFSKISSIPTKNYKKTGRYSKENWTSYKPKK
jgi:deoxycytidine triphosphate deaminase